MPMQPSPTAPTSRPAAASVQRVGQRPLAVARFDDRRARRDEKKTLPLVARYADIWHYFDNLETLSRKNKILAENAEAIGRDHTEIERSQEWAGLDVAPGATSATPGSSARQVLA
ncbi:hypothetical protein [Amycolatopsis saalfeldensis]|uniref:Uncharacterized protein n=1 Tax=Amycolatopsis saalfeldensis TaxID=394193 RepID=A0A1H8YBX0_9PSEU|nr:hypothetical protein [Amycolatopsis saalfeldensis]SEP49750.1 hypothetical protein SAMN04489732_113188 [Amycolatopsis saalfeldensis]